MNLEWKIALKLKQKLAIMHQPTINEVPVAMKARGVPSHIVKSISKINWASARSSDI